MLGAQANEFGVNFAANLDAGSQLNLNDVSITVFYETKANEEGNSDAGLRHPRQGVHFRSVRRREADGPRRK